MQGRPTLPASLIGINSSRVSRYFKNCLSGSIPVVMSIAVYSMPAWERASFTGPQAPQCWLVYIVMFFIAFSPFFFRNFSYDLTPVKPQTRQGLVFIYALYVTSPPITVMSTFVLIRSAFGISKIFLSRTTKSANLPSSSVPFSYSSKDA